MQGDLMTRLLGLLHQGQVRLVGFAGHYKKGGGHPFRGQSLQYGGGGAAGAVIEGQADQALGQGLALRRRRLRDGCGKKADAGRRGLPGRGTRRQRRAQGKPRRCTGGAQKKAARRKTPFGK